MKALSLRPAVRSLVSGCAVLVAAWLVLALSARGTYAAAPPADPSPGKGSAVAPLASPTPWCGYDWRTVSSPNGEGASSTLSSVAAVSAPDVWAVGNRADEAGNHLGPLALHWNGTAWSIVPAPGDLSLYGVDGVAADDVWAVGQSSGTPRAIHWSGTAWTEVPLPALDYPGQLTNVDARSADDVWAVGYITIYPYYGYNGIIMHWDGTAWTEVPAFIPGILNSVYAISADDVWAVGTQVTRLGTHTLISHWDGVGWTLMPSGINYPFAGMSAVDGLSSDQVWAIGGYNAVDGSRHAVVIRWDGTSWATVHDAALDDNYYGLEVIAPDNIWAVGRGYSTAELRRLHWNGSSWSRQATSETGQLLDIAAIDGEDIWAIGYTNGQFNTYVTLVQRYSYVCTTPTPMPTSTSTPIPPRCPTERFTDVCPTDYFYEPVLALSDLGIITGYSTAPPCDGPAHIPCFKPYNGSTRGQIAKVVSLAAGFSEPVPTGQQTFEDVLFSSPFWEYIERMASRSIIQGYPCGGEFEPCGPTNRPYFRPNNPVTRGQLSKMTSEAFTFSEPVSGQTFEDVAPGSTFYEWVQRIASRGIIQGYPCGNSGEPCVPPDNRPYFRPNNPVTRGQTAKIVHLAMLEPTPTPTATPTVEPAASVTATGTTPPATTPTTTVTVAATNTPQATPTCCAQVTGSIVAGCVGSAYQVTTTVTNSCGITLTANIATIFEVAPSQSGPWQVVYIGDCFSCPVPPGTQQQTGNVYSGPLPAGNNWWRYRKGYSAVNFCWSLNLVSEPQPACVIATPTPVPRADPRS